MPTVTAASQPSLITDKLCYLCTPSCEPHTDKDSLIKPPFQKINYAIIVSSNLLFAEILLALSAREDFQPFTGFWNNPSPGFVLSLTRPV